MRKWKRKTDDNGYWFLKDGQIYVYNSYYKRAVIGLRTKTSLINDSNLIECETHEPDINPLQNIENCCQLHEEIRIIYIVDGYDVVLSTMDGQREYANAQGPSILEALAKLNVMLQGKTLENVRRDKCLD